METYLTIEEVAKYLNYAEKTIRKWVLNKEIPFHKIHKSIRFRLSEIEKWVDNDGAHKARVDNEIDEGGLLDETENVGELNGGEIAESGEAKNE